MPEAREIVRRGLLWATRTEVERMRLKLGVIGCGNISEIYLKNLVRLRRCRSGRCR